MRCYFCSGTFVPLAIRPWTFSARPLPLIALAMSTTLAVPRGCTGPLNAIVKVSFFYSISKIFILNKLSFDAVSFISLSSRNCTGFLLEISTVEFLFFSFLFENQLRYFAVQLSSRVSGSDKLSK